MHNILITGVAGFIGSFLAEALVHQGHDVIGVDNLFRGSLENLDALKNHSRFSFVQLDLSDINNVLQLHSLLKTQNTETVFHLAAINGTQHFYDRSFFVLDQNVSITQNVLSAIKNTSVQYIIYTSSSEVYGNPIIIPTDETHPILLNAFADRDSYAASKALGDYYVRLFAEKHDLDYLILRVFNMYGERMVNTRYGQVIPEFIKRILSDAPFTIIGNGTHTRSFCYIKDAVWAMKQLLLKRHKGILNLGNNQEICILALAKKLHAILKKPFNPVFLAGRPYDPERRQPDVKQLISLLPKIKWTPLEVGLLQVIAFYQRLYP